MKTNTKIIMALGILAAFMMVAVPFVAVSGDASGDTTNVITTGDGITFDFAGTDGAIAFSSHGSQTIADLGDFTVTYDGATKTFKFTGSIIAQTLPEKTDTTADSTEKSAFYQMWTENTDHPYAIVFKLTVTNKDDKINFGEAERTATDKSGAFILYMDGSRLSPTTTVKYTPAGGSAIEYKFDTSELWEASVEIDGGTTYYGSFADAVTAVNDAEGDDVVFSLLKGITITKAGTAKQAAIWFTYAGGTITVDGAKNTISYNTTYGSGQNVMGFASGVTAVVKELTIDGGVTWSEGKATTTNAAYHGLNIYDATITLNNVVSKNNAASGITVNRSAVIMEGVCEATGNVWGGVNVDIGENPEETTTSSLTVNGTFNGNIWTESLGKSTVTYNGAKITMTMKDNQSNDKWKFWYSSEDLNTVVQAAIANADSKSKGADNFVITLMDNCSGSGVYVGSTDLSNKTITIDLNGYIYTGDKNAAGSTTTQNQLLHLESGSFTIKDGTLAVKSDNNSFKFLVQNYTDIIATNVIFDGSNLIQMSASSHGFTFAVNVEKGSVSITGGKLIASGSTTATHNYAMRMCADTSYTGVSRTVSLSGTEVVGDILRWCYSNQDDVLTISDSDITGSLVYNGTTADPKIVIKGEVNITGDVLVRSTTVMDVTKGTVVLNTGSAFKLVTRESTIASQINITDGTLTLSTNAKNGFDAVLDGKATIAESFVISTNDKLTIKSGAELTIDSGKTLNITGSMSVAGTVKCNGTLAVASNTTITGAGSLVMGAGSTFTINGTQFVGASSVNVTSGTLTVKISGSGFDATVAGKATVVSSFKIAANDKLAIASGAELTVADKQTLTVSGKLSIDGDLKLVGNLAMSGVGMATVNGKITGGTVYITNVNANVKPVTVNASGVLNTTISDSTSNVVLENVVAGTDGISITKGSVIVDGIIKTGDVTIPAGSTSYVYGTLESGAKLIVEAGASVNPSGTHSGTLVISSGASVESEGSIVSVIYKAGSKLNDETFAKDTKVTESGEIKIAITIYLSADSSKLTVSTYSIEAFAGDDYGDLLSNVIVNGVNKRITFTGWYNALNEKVTSGVTVPDVTDNITLYAHFTETAKPAPIIDDDSGYDYSLVIAFVVLVISIGFLAYVVKKR